jgi:hypothetical protein
MKFNLFKVGSQHRQKKSHNSSVVRHSRSIFFGMFLILFTFCSFTTFSVVLSCFTKLLATSSSYPTSIPWIDNQSECEHTGRDWHDTKCWDNQHSSTF